MTTSPVQRVALIVRAELARQRKTQNDVAAALGMSQTAVSRRITGEVAFDIGELAAVAAFLGVSVTSLLGEVTAGAA